MSKSVSGTAAILVSSIIFLLSCVVYDQSKQIKGLQTNNEKANTLLYESLDAYGEIKASLDVANNDNRILTDLVDKQDKDIEKQKQAIAKLIIYINMMQNKQGTKGGFKDSNGNTKYSI